MTSGVQALGAEMLPEGLKKQPRVDELTMPAMGEQAIPAHCDHMGQEHKGNKREGEMKGARCGEGGRERKKTEEGSREREGRSEGGSS